MTESLSVTELLARSPLFAELTPRERHSLAEQMSDLQLDRRQLLFSRGDPEKDVYLVLEGRIRISVLSVEGRELSFSHAVPGDVFGEIAALDDAPRSADATAITPARLKVLGQSAFRQLLLTNPATAMATIKLLCTRLRGLSKHYEAIALHPVEIRLARLLLNMLEQQSSGKTDSTPSLPLDVTQSELGLLIGTTRQRANAALNALEARGIIRRSKRHLTCNVRELREVALGESADARL